MSAGDDKVVLGRFGRPHGTRGQVRLWVYNADSELWVRGQQLLCDRDGEVTLLTLTDIQYADRFLIVTVDKMRFRDQAEALRNLEVYVHREDLPELEDDEVYLVDLVGAPVYVQVGEGEPVGPVGHVTKLMETGAYEVLVIQASDGRRLLVSTEGSALVSLSPESVVLGDPELWDLDGAGIPPVLSGG